MKNTKKLAYVCSLLMPLITIQSWGCENIYNENTSNFIFNLADVKNSTIIIIPNFNNQKLPQTNPKMNSNNKQSFEAITSTNSTKPIWPDWKVPLAEAKAKAKNKNRSGLNIMCKEERSSFSKNFNKDSSEYKAKFRQFALSLTSKNR